MNIRILIRRFGRRVLLFFGVIGISFCIHALMMRVFTIRTVQVIGQGVQVGINMKKIPLNLLFFPTDLYKKKLLAENPLLADVQFHKVFPSTLRIETILRKPFLRLQTNSRTMLVDNQGYVVGEIGNEQQLPLLMYDMGPVRVGQLLPDPTVQQAIRFINAAHVLVSIDMITVPATASLQFKSGKTDIFITQNDDVWKLAATLQTVITGFRIKGTLPAVIDLRYNKPVVTL